MVDHTKPENRARIAVLACMTLAAVAAFVILVASPNAAHSALGAGGAGPRNLANGDPDLLNYSDQFIGPEKRYYATSVANVRNYPTPRKTYKLWRLEPCIAVTAREVRGFTSGQTWVKLKGDGGYVWSENLGDADSDAYRRNCSDA